MVITNFAEAQAVLRPLYDNARTKYDLTVMRRLMALFDNPQNKLRIVHVAGTSGKTSTAYYASACLEAYGTTVGLTVSPHVSQVNERLQINRRPLPEAEFCAILGEFLDRVAGSGLKPSYFEALVALAYWEFARRGVDYAVIEVGLGGLLDGTNVIERSDKVCVITDIGFDHTEVLGNTLTAIATQKAGIIGSHNVVFMHQQGSEVMAAVQARVDDTQADLRLVVPATYDKTSPLPAFQQRNFWLAAQAADYVAERDQLVQTKPAFEPRAIPIPARFERFSVSGKTIIIDGSHNAQKLSALTSSIQTIYGADQTVAALVAFVSGPAERWQSAVTSLLGAVSNVIVTSFSSEQDLPKQSVDLQVVADFCRRQGFSQVAVELSPGLAYAALLKQPADILLVSGSFYLLNDIRPLLLEAA